MTPPKPASAPKNGSKNTTKHGPKHGHRLAEQVYGTLHEQIRAGKYIEGDKLPSESQLSSLFDVSRSVIREALTRLQGDGLTRTHQGIGTFVATQPRRHSPPGAADGQVSQYLQSLEARIVLEVEAARLAALRRSRAQLEAIQAANGDLREQIARGLLGREQDIRFHNCIAEASGNRNFPILLQSIGELTTRTITAGLKLGRGQIRSRVVEEHAAIVEAIALGDSEAAATYMRYHMFQARSALTGDYLRADPS